MVMFVRDDVAGLIRSMGLTYPTDITLTVTGSIKDGRTFAGSDTIRVIEQGAKK